MTRQTQLTVNVIVIILPFKILFSKNICELHKYALLSLMIILDSIKLKTTDVWRLRGNILPAANWFISKAERWHPHSGLRETKAVSHTLLPSAQRYYIIRGQLLKSVTTVIMTAGSFIYFRLRRPHLLSFWTGHDCYCSD